MVNLRYLTVDLTLTLNPYDWRRPHIFAPVGFKYREFIFGPFILTVCW